MPSLYLICVLGHIFLLYANISYQDIFISWSNVTRMEKWGSNGAQWRSLQIDKSPQIRKVKHCLHIYFQPPCAMLDTHALVAFLGQSNKSFQKNKNKNNIAFFWKTSLNTAPIKSEADWGSNQIKANIIGIPINFSFKVHWTERSIGSPHQTGKV